VFQPFLAVVFAHHRPSRRRPVNVGAKGHPATNLEGLREALRGFQSKAVNMDNMDSMARRLEPIMTSMAKAVLASRPSDIDDFCYHFFASRLNTREPHQSRTSGQKLSVPPNAHSTETYFDSLGHGSDVDETPISGSLKQNKVAKRQYNYESTDEDDEVGCGIERLQFENDNLLNFNGEEIDFKLDTNVSETTSNQRGKSNTASSSTEDGIAAPDPSRFQETISIFSQLDIEDDLGSETPLIRSMQWKEGELQTSLVSGSLLSPEQEDALRAKVQVALGDARLKAIFDLWDTDQNGSVELMELVVGLHKFEKVTAEGSELKKASDALAGAGEAHKAELNLNEFAKLIVQFCEDNYGQPFNCMADHMLKVAQSSSERVVLATSSGGDISQMILDDEEDLQVMKETVKGMEESVVNSVKKIKTVRKVMFK
jgi:hypothetical protein